MFSLNIFSKLVKENNISCFDYQKIDNLLIKYRIQNIKNFKHFFAGPNSALSLSIESNLSKIYVKRKIYIIPELKFCQYNIDYVVLMQLDQFKNENNKPNLEFGWNNYHPIEFVYEEEKIFELLQTKHVKTFVEVSGTSYKLKGVGMQKKKMIKYEKMKQNKIKYIEIHLDFNNRKKVEKEILKIITRYENYQPIDILKKDSQEYIN